MPFRFSSNCLLCLTLIALYVLLGWFGLLLSIPPGYTTLFWPASGIALGFVYRFGYRLLPGVLVGAFILHYFIHTLFLPEEAHTVDFLEAFLIALGTMSEAGFGTFLLYRYLGPSSKLGDPNSVARFLFFGGIVSAFITPAIGVIVYLVNHQISLPMIPYLFGSWYIGHILGIIIFAPFVVVLLNPDIARLRKYLVGFPLLILFMVVIGLFHYSQRQHTHELKVLFLRDVESIRQNLQTTIQKYMQELQALHSFYQASENVTREEFETFATPATKRNKGLRRMIWVPYVSASEKTSYENDIRAAGFKNFKIKSRLPQPARPGDGIEREFFFPITYAAPFDESVSFLIGLDLASERTRRLTMLQAIETGQPTISDRLNFVSEAEKDQYGLLMAIPVYHTGLPLETVEQRRQAVKGLVVAAYRLYDVLSPIMVPLKNNRGISMTMEESSGDQTWLLYNSDNGSALTSNLQEKAAFSKKIDIQIYNQRWTTTYYQSYDHILGETNWAIWMTLIGGTFFTALFGAFLLIITGRAAQIESEVKQRTADLKHAQLMAEEANKSKSVFLANMSHEIRTPMTGIIGMVRLLKDHQLNSQARHYLETISFSADSLLQIIDDILDFSKIEAGKLKLENIPFNLQTLCKNVTELFVIPSWEKGIDFHFHYPAGAQKWFLGDPGRLRQILFNLCSNAIKFTSSGYVELYVDIRPASDGTSNIFIKVTDTGIGIEPEKQNAIFNKFDQVDPSTSRKYGGTGLGLAITRELLTLMNSDIHLKSRLGSGSEFSFHLNLDTLDENEKLQDNEDKTTGEYILFKAHALLAEDNLVNQEVLATLLDTLGIKVTTVSNGEDALKKLEQHTFDIIFMDCQMPVMDGYMATKVIKNNPAISSIPVIAVTARALNDDKKVCLEAGMDDYVSKPIRENEIERILRKWLPDKIENIAAMPEDIKDQSTNAGLAPVLDYDILQKLRSNTRGKFESIINMYHKEAETLLHKMQTGLNNNDTAAIEFAAHSLKTASGQIGAMSLFEHMKMIEYRAGKGEAKGMEKDLHIALQIFYDLKSQLSKVMRRNER